MTRYNFIPTGSDFRVTGSHFLELFEAVFLFLTSCRFVKLVENMWQ